MPLNFIIPENWQVTIGDWDITHLIADFNLRRPRAEISTPYSWQGAFTITASKNPTLLAESLDDLENPYRWAIGMHPVRLRIKGRLVATVRIKRYAYDEGSRQGQAELCDQLGLRDFESPPKDFEGLGFEVSRGGTSVKSVVKKLLDLAGVESSIDTLPGRFEVPPNKFSESYISLAQQICGERGYWLFCDENEVVRVAPYQRRDLLFTRSRGQVKDFERQSGIEIPSEIVRVTGACEKIATCGGEAPQITEEFAFLGAYKILNRRESLYPPFASGDITTRKIVIEQALGSAFPKNYPGSTAITKTDQTTETSYYEEGRLIKRVTKTNKLLGLALPDNFPGNRSMINGAEIVTEEYKNLPPGTYKLGGEDDKVLRGKITTKEVLFPLGTDKYTLAVKERIIESWDENALGNAIIFRAGNLEDVPKCERYEYKRLPYQRDSSKEEVTVAGKKTDYFELGELLLKTIDRQPNQTPPAWTTKEPDFPVGSVTLKGEVKFSPATFSSYYEKEYESNCSFLTSVSEAKALAKLIGELQHQRYRSRLVTMPIPSEWLDDPTPFGYVHIHNGAFLIDSPAIVLEDKTLVFSFIGNYLGSIPVVTDEPPSVEPQPRSPILQIEAISNDYEYSIKVTIDDVFINSKSVEVTANYDYRVSLNPYTIICNWDYEVSLNLGNLSVSVLADYNYEVLMGIGYNINSYGYDVLVNYPGEIACFNDEGG